jgi:hypothetical protein
MNPLRLSHARALTRRHFLSQMGGISLGGVALQSLLGTASAQDKPKGPMAPKPPMKPAKAKAMIYLHMSGAPPALDLFDYKPELKRLHMKPCPDELYKGKQFAFIKGRPNMLGSPYAFKQQGQAGGWFSEQIPQMASIADDICVIRSMWTDQFNHAPAELFLFTGSMKNGSPSLGSWLTYGLGSVNQDLPGFVVLLSGGTDPTGGKALWGSGFLPSVYQGVQCRTTGEPILYSNNPPGMDRDLRRKSLDAIRTINEREAQLFGDPETVTRIAQYELAFRMQMSVPEVFDIAKEPPYILDMYGAKSGQGSFANNCLLARRLVERGVRFVHLFDWGWDIHGTGKGDDLMNAFPKKCKEVDQASAGLVKDLKQRGLLAETVVVWGGEFGRTPMNEARDGSRFLGRDHHPNCFTLWLAGGGIKPGLVFGETDPFGYDIIKDKVAVRDLQATLLELMGLDAFRYGVPYQGLRQRYIGPTDEAVTVRDILS